MRLEVLSSWMESLSQSFRPDPIAGAPRFHKPYSTEEKEEKEKDRKKEKLKQTKAQRQILKAALNM